MIDFDAICSVIADVVEGSRGVYGVTPKKYLRGVFDGQPVGAQQAGSMVDADHRFDVALNNVRENGAAFAGAFASHSIVDVDVVISVTTHTATTAETAERTKVKNRILADGRMVIGALRVPDNLRLDAEGHETGIASGVLRGPYVVRITGEDTENQLIKSEISGLITITVEANPV